MAQRKAAATASRSDGAVAPAPTAPAYALAVWLPAVWATAALPRWAWIARVRPSSVASTVPLRSVRKRRAPPASIRASVSGAGWPYGLTAPTETIAALGRTASRNAWVDEVRLPW